MFVITADQVASRERPDAVERELAELVALYPNAISLAPERTAGDEFQILLDDARTTFDIALRLTRDGGWSVGCGVGSVRTPLPRSIREASGDAFVAARDAVERAKKRTSKWAISSLAAPDVAADLEAITDLLLATRARRSLEGWQLYDLVRTGMTQAAAATALGITPQAASLRAQAADLKLEARVSDAVVTLLNDLNEKATAPTDDNRTDH